MVSNSNTNNAEKLKQAIEKAKQEPDSPQAIELRRRLESGQFNYELKELGMKTFDKPRTPINLSKMGISSISGQLTGEMPQLDLAQLKEAEAEGERSRAGKQITGAASDIGQDFMQMGQNIREGFQKRTETLGEDITRRQADGKLTLREQVGTGLGYTSATLRTFFDAIGEAGMFAAKSVMTPEQEAAVADKFQQGLASTLEATEGTMGREKVEQMIAAYNVWAEENPEDAANVRDTAGIMLSLAEAAGFKVGTTAARQAADIAADAVTTAARATGDAAIIAGRQFDEGLQTAARRAGEILDERTSAARADALVKQQNEVKDAVTRITKAGDDPRAVEQATRALTDIDREGIETFQDLNNRFEDRIKALSNSVDERLAQDTNLYKPDQLKKTTQVGEEIISEEPVIDAIKGLENAYELSGEPVNAARIRQLQNKYETEGLSLVELNNLAREYGIEFKNRAFTKMGEPKQGYNADRYENVRSSVKNIVRDQMPDDLTKELDRKMSDIYSTLDLTRKRSNAAVNLETEIANRTLGQKVGGAITATADLATGGFLRGAVTKLLPSNVGNKKMNILEIQKKLKDDLQKIDKLQEMKGKPGYAEAFEKYVQEMQPGMSIRSTVRPPDEIAKNLDIQDYRTIKEYLLNPADTRAFPKAQQLMERLGIENATDAEQMRFLEDIVNEFDQMENAGGVTVGKPDESFKNSAAQTGAFTDTAVLDEFRELPDGTSFSRGGVTITKQGDDLIATGDGAKETLQNSGIDIDTNGVIKQSDFGYNIRSFLNDVKEKQSFNQPATAQTTNLVD